MRRRIPKADAKKWTDPQRWAEFERWMKESFPQKRPTFYSDHGQIYAEVNDHGSYRGFTLHGQYLGLA